MGFHLTEEQEMLRDSVRGFLSRNSGAPDIWRRLSDELGLLGLTLGEDEGGLGCGAVEAMVVMEEFGAALATAPFVESILIPSRLLQRARSAASEPLFEPIISGVLKIVLAHGEPCARDDLADVQTHAGRGPDGRFRLTGRKAVVVGASLADKLIVSARTSGARRDPDGITLFLIDAASQGVVRRNYFTIDGREAADVILQDVAADKTAMLGQEGQAFPLVEEAIDVGIAAICAEAAGVMRELLSQTMEYTRNRRQGGNTLAAYQVLQHRMVEMMVATQQTRAMARVAANKLEAGAAERAMAASAAKAYVGRAARKVGQAAIQLHGAMGVTDEIPIGNLFRRTTMIEGEFGSVDYHVARYSRHSLDPTA